MFLAFFVDRRKGVPAVTLKKLGVRIRNVGILYLTIGVREDLRDRYICKLKICSVVLINYSGGWWGRTKFRNLS